MRKPLLIAAALGVAWASPAPAPIAPPIAQTLRLPRRTSDRSGVAVTFDDGPHPRGTPAVLEALREEGAHATFFLVGEQIGQREIAAVVTIIAGVAVIASAAPSQPGEIPRDAGLVITLGMLAALAILPYAVGTLVRCPTALLVIGAGAADGLAAFVAKLIAEHASAGRWLAVTAWTAGVAAVVILGVISESTALQRVAATRVAPSVLAMQIAIPVLLAPLVGGESWGGTPLNGAVLGAALGIVVAGVGMLASSPVVAGVVAEQHGEH